MTVDAASASSLVLIIIARIHSNKRIDDLNARITDTNLNLNKRIDDTKEVLLAETKAFRVEVLAEFRSLYTKIDTQIKHHVLELQK